MSILRPTSLALAACAVFGTISAEALSYNLRDTMLVFRKSGSPDLEVNLGSFSTFTTPGLSFNISAYNNTQFTTAFGASPASWVGLSFSVFSAVPTGNGDGTYPNNTILITAPRSDINIQSTPWDRRTSSSQSTTVSKILGVAGYNSGSGAAGWSAGTPFDSVTNSASAIIIPSANASSYTSIAGTGGSLGGTTPGAGSIENTLVNQGDILRSDLYVVKPGSSGQGEYAGYFEFNGSSGTLSFQPVPEPSTIATLGVGSVALVFALRRRSSK